MASETTTPKGDFFDDDNNKAMFLVLPAIIFVYGGCSLIYCVHKCRQHYKRHKRRKLRKQKRKLQEQQKASFTNALMISDDTTSTQWGSHPDFNTMQPTNVQNGVLILESMDPDEMPTRRTPHETDVDSIDDVLQSENLHAVTPGYARENLSHEMQHLDNQLRQAFRLTEAGEGKGIMDPGNMEAAAAASLYPGRKEPSAPQQKPKVEIIPVNDLKSIESVRKQIKTKSRPDLVRGAEENSCTIKRVHVKGLKKEILHSSQ